MLWPPEEYGQLITDVGKKISSPLDASPNEVVWHVACYEEELSSVEKRYRISSEDELGHQS